MAPSPFRSAFLISALAPCVTSLGLKAPLSTCPAACQKTGTFADSQDYWRKGNPQLTEYLSSSEGQAYSCGDVYISVADYSNYNLIADQPKLRQWAKAMRASSGNTGVLWMTYSDFSTGDGPKMVGFVQAFQAFLESQVSAADMKSIAPIGLSFIVTGIPPDYVKEALTAAQTMKQNVTQKLGYAEGSIFVQSAISGQPGPDAAKHVMELADSALMLIYRNAVHPTLYADGLIDRSRYFLQDQCEQCTQPGYDKLKAKITIMLEASCEVGAYCSKISLCARDACDFPNPSGGLFYALAQMEDLPRQLVAQKVVSQEQYDHLFAHDETLFTLHGWEWARCYLGNAFSKKMGYTNCDQYASSAETCRSQ